MGTFPMLSPTLLLASASFAAAQFTLYKLDPATYPKALCLDGTPGGYYISAGVGANASNWLIHTQGGGWCTSNGDCAGRAKSPLGSSSSWAASGCPNSNAPVCYADGGDSGMLSNISALNPDLWAWTKVFVNYCDGGSYAGALEAPITVGTQTIYYRGAYILDAIYSELLQHRGLAAASTVVVKGCSAGGLAAFLHVDRIAAKVHAVNPGARVLGAPGAGFFLGEAAPFSGGGYLSDYKWVYAAHNVSGNVNDACVADKVGSGTDWKCFIAPEVLPYIKTPIFVSNSLSDAWQAGAIMGLGCSPQAEGKCSPAQMTYLSNFRAQMRAGLAPVLAPGSPHGGFLQGCFVHV